MWGQQKIKPQPAKESLVQSFLAFFYTTHTISSMAKIYRRCNKLMCVEGRVGRLRTEDSLHPLRKAAMQPLKMFHTAALCRIVCIRKQAAGLDLSSFPSLA